MAFEQFRASVKFALEGDSRGFDRAVDQAEGGLDRLTRGLTRLAGATVAGVALRQLGQLSLASIGLASDAAEAASAFDTTYGPAARRLGEFTEDAANRMGLANHQLTQMLAVTGSVAQGIGATQRESAALAETMASLAGDVASFQNVAGGAQPVLLALQSALSGEREALKTYGIAISEAEAQTRALTDTGKQHADQLSRLEKAHATLALAQEKASVAVGDLDRTQDSAANRMRRLQAQTQELGVSFGQALLPAAERALAAFEDGLPTIERFIDSAGQIASRLVPALVGGLELTADAVEGLQLLWLETAGIFSGSARASGELLVALRNIRLELIPGEDVATRLANVYVQLESQASLTEEAFTATAQAIGATATEQLAAAAAARQWILENRDGVPVRELDRWTRQLALGTGDAATETSRWAAALQHGRLNAGDTAAAVEELADGSDEAADRLAQLGKEALDAAAGFNTLGDRLRAAAAAQVSLSSAMLAHLDPVTQAAQAVGRYDDAARQLAEAQAEGAASAEELADLSLEVATSALEAQAALDQVSPRRLEDAVRILAEALGVSTAEARQLLETLDLLDGRTIRTVVDVDIRGGGVSGQGSSRLGGFLEFQHGGFTGRSPNQVLPALLHGREFIVPESGLSGPVGRSFAQLVLSAARTLETVNTPTAQTAVGTGGPAIHIENLNVYNPVGEPAAESFQTATLALAVAELLN